MILTTIAGKNGKIHIHINGEYRTTVDKDFWFSERYRFLKDIDENELTELLSAVSFRRAYNKGLEFLSRRLYGSKELFRKLCEKGFDEESAQKAVDRLLELHLLDDEDFAECFAKNLYERKGFSENRIKKELVHRGIDRGIAENVVDTLDIDPQNRIILLLRKKYINKINDEKGRERTVRTLMRLGYSYSDIKNALKIVFENEQDEFYE